MRSQLAWGFFFFFFSCARTEGYEPCLPFTRSTRTPLHCGGRNPSTPSSPCLLSGGWRSARCLCCLPWSFCAQNLGGEVGRMRRGVGDRKSGWRRSRAGRKLVFLRVRRAWGRLKTSPDCGPAFGLFLQRHRQLVWNALIVEAGWKRMFCYNTKSVTLIRLFYSVRHSDRAERRIHLVFFNKPNIVLLEILSVTSYLIKPSS